MICFEKYVGDLNLSYQRKLLQTVKNKYIIVYKYPTPEKKYK